MARLNKQRETIYTHEGAKAKHINDELQLRRSIMSCLLWENQFYENGEDIAKRIANTIPKVDPNKVLQIAVEARNHMKLRHAPLWLANGMVKTISHRSLVAEALVEIIQRPDELCEFLAMYWKEGKSPIANQVKKGLAKAFTKFDEYQLAKYNRDSAIKLRDVLFLCHAKPKNNEQGQLWKRLIDGRLATPDTWEVALSTGQNKKEAWERLLGENKLGALALLRNLRNFNIAKVDDTLVLQALEKVKVDKVLPFRFIAAARYAPQWEDSIEKAMLKCLSSHKVMPGRTVLLVDVSYSMQALLSRKSEMIRMDAGFGLAVILREICDKVDIFSFSNHTIRIPARHGFALCNAISRSQNHSGTYLGEAVAFINREINYDRLIVITDEQSHSRVPDPKGRGYMINVASYENGVGYGKWNHIDGWSEKIVDYIQEYENLIYN